MRLSGFSNKKANLNPGGRLKATARWLSYVAALVLILLPFHEFLAVWASSNFGHSDLVRVWKEILIIVMIPPAIWIAWNSPELKRWLTASWILRLYIVYIVLHLLIGAWSLSAHQVSGQAFIYALIINLRFIAFSLLCAVIAAHDDFLKRNWHKLLLIPAGIAVLFGILQRVVLPLDFLRHFGYSKHTILPYETVDNNLNYQRVQSTLRGANPFGAYLTLIIPAAVLRLRTNSLAKPLYLLACIVALFYTYSRSAWIGSALALAVIAFGFARGHFNRRIVYVVLAAVIVMAGGLYAERNKQAVQKTVLHTSAGSKSPSSSNQTRSASLKGGLASIKKHPLGFGPGTAGPASFRNAGHSPKISENYYLQIAQEVGIFGGLIFIAINVLMARELYARRDLLSQILLASLVGITFINTVSHAWADDTLSLLWWGLAGVAIAPILMLKTDGREKA